MRSRGLLLKLIGLASLTLLTACASPSVITLTNGQQIQTLNSPSYNKSSGFYEYKALDGKQALINKETVETIKRL